MEGVVTSVIDGVVGLLFIRITKEVGYWVCSGNKVKAMKKEMVELDKAAKIIEKQKEYKDVKGIRSSADVLTWLKQVEDIRKEAERIATDEIGIGCFNIKTRYKEGKQSSDVLSKTKSKVEKIPHKESTGGKILAKVASKHQASTSGTADGGSQNSSDTRDVTFKQVLKCLEPKNSETQMIALCGMVGVGKSHTLERLKKHVKDANMFYWVLKVTVGQNTDLIALQNAVAEQTGGALTDTTSDARRMGLKNRFTAMSNNCEKKILVILDDLWKEVDLQDIGLTSPLPTGFKLLITSRNADFGDRMEFETSSVFSIGPLNDVEAKTLFFKTVGLPKDDDPYLYEIGEKIIKRCGNLPMALKIIASTLKGHIKDESEWEDALSHLQHHDLEDHYETVYQVFKISYDSLKKDEKAMFLLSGLFLDDYDIPVEELMRYSWGLKLLSEENTTLANARRQVKTCVNKLISANLLAESDRIGYVKMHNLAHAFALSNITEVKQESIVTHDDISKKLTKDANKSYQRILLKCTSISEFPKEFNCPELTFFKIMDGNKQLQIPKRIYKDMGKLKVISYEEMRDPLLPRSLRHSTNITTLCLHRCDLIRDFSPIGDLVSLEVLSFADSCIKKLPSAIGKLKNLKLLELTGCSSDLSIDDGVFRNLDQLKELYMRLMAGKLLGSLIPILMNWKCFQVNFLR